MALALAWADDEVRDERQQPERRQAQAERDHRRRTAERPTPRRGRERAGQRHEQDRQRPVRGMRQDHRGDEERRHRARAWPPLDPWDKGKGKERKQAPAQARGHEPPAHSLLCAAARPRGNEEGEECGGQRRPPRAERSSEQRIGRRGREQEHEPHQDQVEGARAREPEGQPVQGIAQIEEERGIVLELGISGPPAGVPVPGGRAEHDDVDQAIELTRMIVHARDTTAERRPAPRDGVDSERDCRDHRPKLHAGASIPGFSR